MQELEQKISKLRIIKTNFQKPNMNICIFVENFFFVIHNKITLKFVEAYNGVAAKLPSEKQGD